MFDIGFSELLVIAIVALIVIGPERLPKVARTLGHLFGRMQRYVNDVKADITREMELDELRKLQSTVEEAARSIQNSVNKEVSETESELNKVAQAALPAPDYPDAAAVPDSGGANAVQQLDLALESTPDAPLHEGVDSKIGVTEADPGRSAIVSPQKQA
jgi:sec-independent protein translocase protein TatB